MNAVGLKSICQSVFGVQAQDSVAARMSIWQRITTGPSLYDTGDLEGDTSTLSQITDQLVNQNSGFIRIWGQRGTLQWYDINDWSIVSGAVGKRIITQRIAHNKKGSGPDSLKHLDTRKLFQKTRDRAESILSGSIDNRFSIQDFKTHKLPTALRYSTFLCTTLNGHGARIDLSGTSVLAPSKYFDADFEWEEIATSEALIEAARRYFNTFGPALETDFRYYMGLLAADSKAAVKKLVNDKELVEIIQDNDGIETKYLIHQDGLEAIQNDPPPLGDWPVRLLGRFDPLILAHKDKSFWITQASKPKIWSRNADIRPTIFIHGRIGGVWKYTRQSTTVDFEFELFPEFADLDHHQRSLLENQALGISTFFEFNLGTITWV
eukprot:TRINITY_DN1755_c0_g1_i3.p1 TRINITY_DN1755_c0_g1~~TRINITY_DN1755_c0_g1_i3.p1  ORF type:complete len:379 (+),score=92.12 TRINITY_DN1755_c0_g1_i3:191-1327(+)